MQHNLVLDFINDLINKGGFSQMPEDRLKEYRENLTALVSKKMGIEMVKYLKEEDIEKYMTLIENKPDPDTLYQFFNERVENMDQKIVDVLQQFRQQFLNNLKTAENMNSAS